MVKLAKLYKGGEKMAPEGFKIVNKNRSMEEGSIGMWPEQPAFSEEAAKAWCESKNGWGQNGRDWEPQSVGDVPFVENVTVPDFYY